MQQPPNPPPPLISPAVVSWLRKPQFLIPAAVVVGMIAIAFGVQPGGAQGQTQAQAFSLTPEAAQPTAQPTVAKTPAASPTQPAAAASAAQGTGLPANAANTGINPAAIGGSSDVAGARSTPTAIAADQVDLSHQSNACGAIQESATALSVEQSINGVSAKAQRVATYPIEYFRCILMATGTQESFSLASAVAKAQSAGMTHAVLVDLWITNGGRDFGQMSLKESVLALAGQTFVPLATLGGRADVVIASGQGRNVTVVVAVKNSVGTTTGPMTLTIPAPMTGGKVTAGKYQLFLPTP